MNQSKIEQALRISSLMKKYLNDALNDREREELEQWLVEHPQDRKDLQQLVTQKLSEYERGATKAYDAVQPYATLISRIREGNPPAVQRGNRIRPFYQFAAAAAVILLLAVSLLIFKRQENVSPVAPKIATVPAKKGVELTLANGKKINLETQAAGLIASESQAIITKQEHEVLSYQTTATAQSPNPEMQNALNTLTIPRGKQYQLILPDGSKVWLNAQSTLSFPSSFNKKERIVELTGEGYFEVSHVSTWPFRVMTRGQQVEVLGTKFNIKAYTDDDYSMTTLLSGSVKVSDEFASRLLKPGQSALKANAKSGFTITDTDINEAIAWKDGKVIFTDEKIENITQTLSRTFDVDFDIDERIMGQHFGGSFSVKKGLPNLLRSLEQTEAIKFKVKGRRISVMP